MQKISQIKWSSIIFSQSDLLVLIASLWQWNLSYKGPYKTQNKLSITSLQCLFLEIWYKLQKLNLRTFIPFRYKLVVPMKS